MQTVYNSDYLLRRVKHCGSSVIVWTAISGFSVGFMIALQEHITDKNYVNILADPVHHMLQFCFPSGDGVIQDDKYFIYKARIIQDWISVGEDDFSHFPCPPSHQISILLNFCGLHWIGDCVAAM